METYEALEPALLDGWVRARSLHERADVYSHPMRAFLESKAYGHPNWYATVTVDGNGNAGPFGGDPRLFDTAGDAIPDGRNTVECRYP